MMLQRIHERISGWIAGVVIALVAGAFVLFGVEYYFQQGAGDKDIAATVNGRKISDRDVSTMTTQLMRRASMQMGGKSLPDFMTQQIKSMALQSLITNTALVTTLEGEGFQVGDSQIKMIIAKAPEFQENGVFSQSRFQQVLMQVGLTPMSLFHRLQNEVIINQVMTGLDASSFTLPNELLHFYKLSQQKRQFGYATISPKLFNAEVVVPEKAVKDYYQAHEKKFQTPEKVSVNYLLLSPSEIEKSVTVTADQAKSYYESNMMNYQIPARWKVEQVTLPLAKNATNNDVARVKSEAEKLAKTWEAGQSPKNISTVTISGADASKKLEDTLTALKKNQVSLPLRTEQGFTLLKVIDFTPKQTRSFASVEKNIIAMQKAQRVNQLVSSKASQLSDLTYTSPDTLEPAAKALGLKIMTSGLMSKAGEKTGIFADPKVLKAVFGDTVLRDGNNSDPIVLSDGSQLVVRVKEKAPSKLKPFVDVQKQIETLLKEKQLKAKAGVVAYQMQQQLAQGINPGLLAKKLGATWHAVGLVSQDDKQLSGLSQIVATAFSTPVTGFSSKNNKPVGVNTVLLPNGDYAVIAIDQVVDANVKDFMQSQRDQVEQGLTQLYAQLLHQFYIQSVVASSKVVVQHK